MGPGGILRGVHGILGYWVWWDMGMGVRMVPGISRRVFMGWGMGEVPEGVIGIWEFWGKSNETGASKSKTSSNRSKISPIRSSVRHQTGRSTGYTR